MDGDGDIDVVIANLGMKNQLYVNDGMGFLTAITSSAIAVGSEDSYALAVADVDGDADIDVVIINSGGQPNRLYRFVHCSSGARSTNAGSGCLSMCPYNAKRASDSMDF